MQTKMIAKHIEVSYICPKCDFKFTLQSGVYDNSEFSDKILQKVENNKRECIMCKKSILRPKSVICRVDPIINQNYYEIKWECEECDTQWNSIHDLNPNQANFSLKLSRIKDTTVCINERCRSRKVKTVLLTFNRKI